MHGAYEVFHRFEGSARGLLRFAPGIDGFINLIQAQVTVGLQRIGRRVAGVSFGEPIVRHERGGVLAGAMLLENSCILRLGLRDDFVQGIRLLGVDLKKHVRQHKTLGGCARCLGERRQQLCVCAFKVSGVHLRVAGPHYIRDRF